MRDITNEQIERKTLSEDCWIDLEDFQIRIDYPTYSQTTELRRLAIQWGAGQADENTEHYLGYYLRATLRGVKGLFSNGKELTLELERGLAKNFIGGDKPLDVIATFVHLKLLELAVSEIQQKLQVSGEDKKKSLSQPNSLKREEPEEPSTSTPVLTF